MNRLTPIMIGIGLVLFGCKDDSEYGTDTAGSEMGSLFVPANLSATAGYNEATLDWDKVSGATIYKIFWASSSGVNSSSTTITSISDDNYTHTGLNGGSTYYYKVAAATTTGTGTLSNEVSVAPLEYFSTKQMGTSSLDEANGVCDSNARNPFLFLQNTIICGQKALGLRSNGTGKVQRVHFLDPLFIQGTRRPKHFVVRLNGFYRIGLPFGDLLLALPKRIPPILIIQYVGPDKLVDSRTDVFLYLQFCLCFKSDTQM